QPAKVFTSPGIRLSVARPRSVPAAFTDAGTTTRVPSLRRLRVTAALKWSPWWWVTRTRSALVQSGDFENGSMAMIIPPPAVIRNEDWAILTSWVSVQALRSGLDIVGSSSLSLLQSLQHVLGHGRLAHAG